MAHINLLPWREEARKARQKNYVSILALVALISFLLFFIINLYYSASIEGQARRNAFLQSEISVLDARIKEIEILRETKRSLQRRMSLIEQLQSSRNLGTQIMTEVAVIVPNGVYLTSLEKKGVALQIVGKSESNNRLSNMLRQAEQSELFYDAYLQFIEAGKERTNLLSDFRMNMKITGFDELESSAASTSSSQQGRR
jgi:type IV pilus assembly protein PilN